MDRHPASVVVVRLPFAVCCRGAGGWFVGERYERIKSIFLSAAGLDENERAAFLDRECEDDDELRAEVERLLGIDAHVGSSGELEGADGSARIGSSESRPEWVGPFRILSRLGEGGFGVVYLAEQTEPIRRRVAVKIVKPGMDSARVLARFEAERHTLAMMDHPNIARVLDAGVTDASKGSRPFFVMEHVPGEPITDYADRHRLTIRDRIGLVIQVCRAIHHAHQKGIIHRDIKPNNVLISIKEGQVAVPKVIDFGVAKALHQRLKSEDVFTEQGQVIGTPEYMSPEQAEMGPLDIDTRSDVYSLGVLLYELLAGARPFNLRDAAMGEVAQFIRDTDPPRPSTRLSSLGEGAAAIAELRRTTTQILSRTLSSDLEWIPMKALRKDRTERYQSAARLAEDLTNYLEGKPLEAGPESAAYRIKMFARRNRLMFRSLVIVVLSFVLGSMGLAYGLVVANSARVVANSARDRAEAKAEDERLARIEAEDAREVADRQVYLSHISVADAAIATGSVRQARLRLEACDPRRRGWEWHHLAARLDGSLAVLTGHTRSVRQCAISPDGTVLLTGSWDGSARLWNAVTGDRIAKLSGHTDYLTAAAFDSTGERVVTASRDKTARIWNASTGIQIAPLEGHDGEVLHASFSPDGTLVVTCSADETARIWDGRDGSSLAVLDADAGPVLHASFSPDGASIVTGHADGTARLWQAFDGEPGIELNGHTDEVVEANFSPDGSRIVTASSDGTARLWDARNGERIALLEPPGRAVSTASFSPDGSLVVTVSDDETARLWDAVTGEEKTTFSGHKGTIRSAAFSADGTMLITASADRTARVWDTLTGKNIAVLRGHEDDVWYACFSPDGSRVLTASLDRTARLWSSTDEHDIRVLVNSRHGLQSVAFDPSGGRIATASPDTAATIWNVFSGREEFSIGDEGIQSVTFSPDGSKIATGSQDGVTRIWDSATGSPILELTGDGAPVNQVSFNSDGARLAAATDGGSVMIWSTKTWDEVGPRLEHAGPVLSVAFSPDGRIVGTGSEKTVRLWSLDGHVESMSFNEHDDLVTHVAFSADGRLIASASSDYTARVWNPRSDVEPIVLQGHEDSVLCVAFLPDDSRIVTTSRDDSVRLWNPQSGAEVGVLRGHESAVPSLAIGRDGSTIITTSQDGTARLWSITSGRQRFANTLRNGPGGMEADTFIRQLRAGLNDWAAVARAIRADTVRNQSVREIALALVTVEAERRRIVESISAAADNETDAEAQNLRSDGG